MNLLVPALLTTGLALSPAPPGTDTDPRGTGVWPLSPAPEVVQRFDPPGSRFGAGHRGVDLAGKSGQPVSAALGGQVAFAGRLAGRGVLVVSHGQTRTTYEPVRGTVKVGDLVGAGDVIGILELPLPLSHCRPAACLHWGWVRDETYLDPLVLVGAGRVRLLPLSGLASVPTSFPPPPVASAPDAPGLPERLLPARVRLDGLGGGLAAGIGMPA